MSALTPELRKRLEEEVAMSGFRAQAAIEVLQKDRISGETQAHGEHGYFSSGSGGSGSSSESSGSSKGGDGSSAAKAVDGTGMSGKEVAGHLNEGHHISIDPSQMDELSKHVASTAGDDRKTPFDEADLSKLHINGMEAFDKGKDGIYDRTAMPQVRDEMMDSFKGMLSKNGVDIHDEMISPRDLNPSQRDFSLGKTTGMREFFSSSGKFDEEPKPGSGILVDKDNNIIDGHHRWAAYLTESMSNPDIQMPIVRIDASQEDLIGKGDTNNPNAGHDGIINEWMDSNGVQRAGLGEVSAPGAKAAGMTADMTKSGKVKHGDYEFDPEDEKDKRLLDHVAEIGAKSKARRIADGSYGDKKD